MKDPVLDLSAFRWIDSQTTLPDREALLSLQRSAREDPQGYRYLEVGSHLGGSLQPHVLDPLCRIIYSIDPRPLEQPDERTVSTYRYDGNSTQRMLLLLSSIPLADISKIRTFEHSSWELEQDCIPNVVDLAFIDGEHTNHAVWNDFVSVRKFLATPSVLAFHDCFVTPKVLMQIARTLKGEVQENACLHYPGSNVVAIVFGSHSKTNDLMLRGWKPDFPLSWWNVVKLSARRNFPRLISIYRGLRGIPGDGG